MKRTVDLRAIERRAKRADVTLPRAFSSLVATAKNTELDACWFLLRGDATEDFGLTRDAARRLVPFMRLGDGGHLALWRADGKLLPIVHFDSEGGRRVVARDLPELFARMRKRRTGVPDLDDASTPLALPAGGPLRPLGALQRSFAAFCKAGSASRVPDTSVTAEATRERAHTLARRLVRDGRQRPYRPRDWWSVDLRAHRNTRGGHRVEYLEFGAWHPLPASYRGPDLVAALADLCKRPNKPRLAITITKEGLVSVNRDRELLLLAPATRRP